MLVVKFTNIRLIRKISHKSPLRSGANERARQAVLQSVRQAASTFPFAIPFCIPAPAFPFRILIQHLRPGPAPHFNSHLFPYLRAIFLFALLLSISLSIFFPYLPFVSSSLISLDIFLRYSRCISPFRTVDKSGRRTSSMMKFIGYGHAPSTRLQYPTA